MIKMESVISNKKLDLRMDKEYVVVLILGFFLSRVNILGRTTPFGIAFLGSYIIMKEGGLGLLLSVILGTISFHGFKALDYSLIALIIFSIFNKSKEVREVSLFKASTTVSCIYLSSKLLIKVLARQFFIYDLLTICFEAVLVFTMTYIFSFSLPIEGSKRVKFSQDNLICSFITLALVLSGFNNLNIFGLSLKNIISLVGVIYLSYSQGTLIGIASGTTIAMISYISHVEMPFIVSILAIGGLLAGLFRDLGKTGSILGFILGNAIISFYINGLGTSFLDYKELFISIVGFLLLHHFFHNNIEQAFANNSKIKMDYEDRKMEVVRKKLNNIEDLFTSLGKTFKDSMSNKDLHSNVEIYSLIDDIGKKNCTNCTKYTECWESNYYTTYYKLFTLLELLESKVHDQEKLSNIIEGFCIKVEGLICAMEKSYEMFKVEYSWNLKLRDQRLLLAEQLKGVGRAIEIINKDIYSSKIFNDELEDLLLKELKDSRVDIRELVVVELEKDNFEILIDMNSRLKSGKEIEKVKEIVSRNLGYPVASDFTFGSMREDRYSFKLVRSNRFDSLTKVKTMASWENKISGDNYTYGEKENTAFLAISDGMGIGEKASVESAIAIELFEKLMEINLDKETTIRTINSVLRTKSNDEIFTTLDVGFIDLYTGKLQVLKTGAPATFIKRGNEVSMINSLSLPIGILKDVDFNIYEEYLEDGDIIIMMSDGVLDSNKNTSNSEEWMKKVINNIKYKSPDGIAEEILSIARFVSKGRPRDDMTVMATKIWRSI